MKKWQKLVINHLGTLRNPDSPINGSRVSSPQINGAIRVTENPGTLSSERANKSRLLEGKKRGVKRKRDSCSSSENSPVVFLKCDDLPYRAGTPTSNDETSQLQSVCSLPEFQRTGEDESSLSLPKNDHCPSTEMVDNDCSVDSGIGSQKDSESLVQGNLSQSSVTRSEYNEPTPGNAASGTCVSQNCQEDLTEIRWNPLLNTECCESAHQGASGSTSADNHELETRQFASLEQEGSHALTPKELVLDVNVQADGVTGRYDSNGTWHDWTDVMSSSDGALNILPYVILE